MNQTYLKNYYIIGTEFSWYQNMMNNQYTMKMQFKVSTSKAYCSINDNTSH